MRGLRLHLPGLLLFGLISALPARSQESSARPGGRWQMTLADGTYLWELRLVRLAGDTLVVAHGDTLRAVPLVRIDELRLVQGTVKTLRRADPGGFGGLSGAGDEVYKLTLDTVAEKRRVIEAIFRRAVEDTMERH